MNADFSGRLPQSNLRNLSACGGPGLHLRVTGCGKNSLCPGCSKRSRCKAARRVPIRRMGAGARRTWSVRRSAARARQRRRWAFFSSLLEGAECLDADADDAEGPLLLKLIRRLPHLLQAVLGGEVERLVVEQLAQGAL